MTKTTAIDPQEYWNHKKALKAEVEKLQADYDNDVKRYNELTSQDIEDRAKFDEMKKIERTLNDKKEFVEVKHKQYEKNVVKKGFEVVESSKALYEQADEDIKSLQKKMNELKTEMEQVNGEIRQRYRDYLKDHGEQYGDMFNETSSISGFWKDPKIIPEDKEWVKWMNRGWNRELRRLHQPEPYKPNLGETVR